MGMEFDKRKGEYFDNIGDDYFGIMEGENFENRLNSNKPGVDSVKVKKDLVR